MEETNLLFILSDQHNRNVAGCYGHPVAQTPNLDRLAEEGVRFNNAYTTCPICVPARASLATGAYVHQIGNWDNAIPYDGTTPSWGHRLRQQGFRVDSIGKLHFSREEDDHGFTQEIDPLHVVDGVGDLLGSVRDDPPFRDKRPGILEAGPGDSTYLRYDASNADHACDWLVQHGQGDKPWVLFLSFVCPHPPYIAPPSLYDRYPHDQIPMPPQWREQEWPHHPALDYFRRYFTFDEQFGESTVRQMNAAYYAVCTYLDAQIGRVLEVLEEQGLGGKTRIIYTSDHGEHMGARGIFGKFTMYDESVAVPLIISGPDVPHGRIVETPVSLVDCYPTILEAVGAVSANSDQDLPGESLWQLANAQDHERTVFSEYHALGTRNAIYMLRKRQYKYVYYVNSVPQLFDLHSDPNELVDLAMDERYTEVVQGFERDLRALLDPDAVDAQAKMDQRTKVEAYGGTDAVVRRGAFENSPTPGETPVFR